jgi:hypothetical protein
LSIGISASAHGGAEYHELSWAHNQAVEDALHTVTIRENGVELVDDRDARLEHDDADAIELLGGFHREVLLAPDPTAENAEFRIFTYEVDLKLGGVLIATYQTTISGYYLGDGDPDSPGGGGGGGFDQAPTPIIAPAQAAYSMRASWTDDDPTALTRINWEYGLAPTYDFVPLDGGDVLLDPGIYQHTISNLQTGTKVRARIRYGSAVAVGDWSEYSNELIVGGSGGGSVAPTITPPTPTITNQLGFIARAAWTGASTLYKRRARFEMSADGVSGWTLAGTVLVNAVINQADKPIPDGMFARVQIAYENSGGTGPYSAFSSAVEILI